MKFVQDNLFIIVLLALTVLVLALLAVVVSAALRSGVAGAAAAKTLRMLGAESLRLSFRRAVKLIEANLAARSERYGLAWTLLLNESDGDDVPLAQSGLSSALSADSSLSAAAQGITWHFFDKGVVVQLRSNHLGAPDPDSAGSTGVWDDFLSLCRRYRPQRPFDSVVLAIPCAALLGGEPAAQAALLARATSIHRRLWLAQNRLALRFPIHLMVTECEAIAGFAAFGTALPEPLRRSMLGWASPYDLAAPFQSGWVDSALDQIVGAVTERCGELGALEPAGADSGAYFLLPSGVERLRAGLQLFCEELMRPSAYHDAFLLRGIYLTGDATGMPTASAGSAAPAAGEPLVREPSLREPAPLFLRDIFERKIFAETGLVRASTRRLRRPAVSVLASWSAWSVPALWAVAMIVAAFGLHDQAGAVLAYLGDRDSGNRRVMHVLADADRLGSARFGAVVLPGSWPLFDDLDARLKQRLTQRFATDAVDALRKGVIAQTVRLTGATPSAAGGALVPGTCTLPQASDAPVPSGIAALELSDLPAYRAQSAYLQQLDHLDQGIRAMERLRSPGSGTPADDKDLVQAVNLILTPDRPLTSTRAGALYRAAVQGEPPLKRDAIQAAARCALQLSNVAMYNSLFDDNALLRTEQRVTGAAASLRSSTPSGMDIGAQLALWQALRAALDEQKEVLSSGKGGWMQQTTLDLGVAGRTLQAGIHKNSLLGPDAEREAQDLAAAGFSRFRRKWESVAALDGPAGPAPVWTDKGWAFTPQRMALADGVATLLTEPYMHSLAPLALPDVPDGTTVRWDRAQVEGAAGLIDARKTFQANVSAKLPLPMQPPAGALADLALVAATRAALAQALSVAPPAPPDAASDAERAAVVKLRDWMSNIGQARFSDELDAVLTRDALTRLKYLDRMLARVGLYLPRDRALSAWQGQKAPLADAFAGGDPAALTAYVAAQQAFVFDIDRQAESVLAQLAGPAFVTVPEVMRWKALDADIARYKLKSPTSSLMALEQFIVNGSADIDSGNCSERLSGRGGPRPGADLFADRLQMLRADLLARCHALAADGRAQAWQHFADAYNRDLGRHPPFAAVAAGGVDSAPADRDTVLEVMKLYDRARAAGGRAGPDAGLPPPTAAVHAADAQLRRVRDLFGAIYPATDDAATGLDVTAQFRVNGAAEQQANQIIDWRLTVGTSSVRLGEPARALHWEPGMPVLLTLRLARDGATVPKPEAGRADLRVADRTAVFRCDDPWALLSFINAYRDGAAAGDDGHGPLLRFEFPLSGNGAAAPVPPDARARVFVRLRVTPPGKRAALPWPDVFPVQVPPWQEPQKAPL